MPMHDWTRVDACISHAFHHEWISEFHPAVLRRLPPDYYSLAEQQAAGFGPDVLTVKRADADDSGGGTVTRARPKTSVFHETATEFYLRKKKSVVVRHVSNDRIVAIIEIGSPGNKNSAHGGCARS
jgi:hypothetical protein